MGMRFRKSKSFGGFRINLSKRGIGWSVGCKGARYTRKSGGGTRKTVCLPGTGVSYVKESGSSGRRIGFFSLLGYCIVIPFWISWKLIKLPFTLVKKFRAKENQDLGAAK